ncbi:MAG: Gfo/Idh/MocA family oxidoreductase [Planctomycetaceae bacterium]
MTHSRRDFLKSTTAAGLAGAVFGPTFFEPQTQAAVKPRAKVERIGIGAIGMRYQGTVITLKAQAHGEVVAIADVDRHVREQARSSFGSTPRIFEDYRDLLKRKDVDVVMIGTPDHWHSKMLIDAVRAGKDVYCEKPLTLTIDEGKRIREVVKQSGRTVQVGTWQRSDHRFRLAVELVRAGRLGKLHRVTCTTDKNPSGGPFAASQPPRHFNWELWQGQTPSVPYIEERSHYTFRWWYEYSGGKMTDWGAHHIDIAQWAIDSLPVHIDGKATLPNIKNGYNVATNFAADIRYANGVELRVRDEGRRGILFEGDRGRIFVNRAVLAGKPVAALKQNPIPREMFSAYGHDNLSRPERAGKLDAIINHMGNFFDCLAKKQQTISDVESQHRSVSTCHLANISMRLGRPLKWDPVKEQFVGDKEADNWLTREQRKGYEVA